MKLFLYYFSLCFFFFLIIMAFLLFSLKGRCAKLTVCIFQIEAILQVLGSAALIQFVSKKLLFAEVCLC